MEQIKTDKGSHAENMLRLETSTGIAHAKEHDNLQNNRWLRRFSIRRPKGSQFRMALGLKINIVE
ncbi:hypothetical protein [uncultured Proteiniphilum sp.]|uniref:hypothetical protein n=1 Tax=uncultured Proteiniphilum sp. TaxID=497637 RepID=UPI002601A0DE|nr:hypothetical protein [uncultured Proteiniphilum sp.]